MLFSELHRMSSSLARSFMKHSSEVVAECGHIHVVIGPMFSGKTTTMGTLVERYAHAGLRCCIVRYVADNRYSDNDVVTHRGMVVGNGATASVTTLTLAHLRDGDFAAYDVVGVDEGQFFDDIVSVCDELARNKYVVVAYLDADSERRAFGPVGELVARAEHVDKLTAVCKCGRNASFSRKFTVAGDSIVDIGGGDKYAAVCRRCHTGAIADAPVCAMAPLAAPVLVAGPSLPSKYISTEHRDVFLVDPRVFEAIGTRGTINKLVWVSGPDRPLPAAHTLTPAIGGGYTHYASLAIVNAGNPTQRIQYGSSQLLYATLREVVEYHHAGVIGDCAVGDTRVATLQLCHAMVPGAGNDTPCVVYVLHPSPAITA